MAILSKNILVYLLSFAMTVVTLPRWSRGELPSGKTTADEAAEADRDSAVETTSVTDGWALAFADTTEPDYEFPEEEEDRHLLRDITVWVIVTAFVGFFIIKVFLEGDTDQEPPPEGGKTFPPSPSP